MIITDLRKGRFSIQIKDRYNTDTVRAEAAKVELVDGVVTFKLTLKPIDAHQVSDANSYREEGFRDVEYFALHDSYIRKGLGRFWKAYEARIEGWCIEVDYGQKFRFPCSLKHANSDGVKFCVTEAN